MEDTFLTDSQRSATNAVMSDLSIYQLAEIENMTVRSVNTCLGLEIRTLKSMLREFAKNPEVFSRARNCGEKTSLELIEICRKYSYLDVDDPGTDIIDFESLLSVLGFSAQTHYDLYQIFHRKRRLPLLKTIEYLINDNILMRSEVKNIILKDTFNLYPGQEEWNLRIVAGKCRLSRERVRQLRDNVRQRLDFLFLHNSFIRYKKLYTGYIGSEENPVIVISDEYAQQVNKADETNFSKKFMTFWLASIFRETHASFFKTENLNSNKRHDDLIYYLIHRKYTEKFNFDYLFRILKGKSESRLHEDLDLGYDMIFQKCSLKSLTDEEKDQIKGILKYIIDRTFTYITAGDDAITVKQNRDSRLQDHIKKLITEAERPLHYSEICEMLEKSGIKCSYHGVLQTLIHSKEFGRKGAGMYDLRSRGGYFGTVGDVAEQILKNARKPIPLKQLQKLIMQNLSVSDKSINTILFSYEYKRRFKKENGMVWLEEKEIRDEIEKEI